MTGNDSTRVATYAHKGHGAEGSPVMGLSRDAQPHLMNKFAIGEALSKDDLLYLVGLVERNPRVLRDIRECGWKAGAVCKDHGERRPVTRTCKQGAHAGCASGATSRLAGVAGLPDLEGEASYRSVWLNFPVDHGASYDEQETAIAEAVAVMAEWSRLTSRSRRWKGVLLSRGMGFWLSPGGSMGQLRLLLREETQGQADPLLWELIERFAAVPIGDGRTQWGEEALLQAMHDAASTLLGMSDLDEQLFCAWWAATKRKKLFQTYSALYKAEREREERTPLVCDVPGCGRKLEIVTYGPPPGELIPPVDGDPLLAPLPPWDGPPPPAQQTALWN